jgi:benzoyl-CoA reductase/2-hydroxyglutaryl-CoA dehydratase subunit BcrC/BadD/HgdB
MNAPDGTSIVERWVHVYAIRMPLNVRLLIEEVSRAEARVQELTGVVRVLLNSAHPHPIEHPAMTKAWDMARAALAETEKK